jgi:hypothetical protein
LWIPSLPATTPFYAQFGAVSFAKKGHDLDGLVPLIIRQEPFRELCGIADEAGETSGET